MVAILSVFLYHSTRFFNLGDWHVKNVNTYVWVEIWNIFATRWMMPLFFIISGASLFYAIGKSGGWRKFYVDKFLRLNLPSWVLDENPLWKGNYTVKYWDEKWQKIIATGDDSYLKRIINAGFDGAYLDIVDGYETFEEME